MTVILFHRLKINDLALKYGKLGFHKIKRIFYKTLFINYL